MRHIVFPALAFTALCLATACQYETLPDSPKNGLRMMTVHASHADTRTYVSQKGNNWVSAWDEYDKIDLFELSDDNCSYSVSSECGIDLDADGKATFTMWFADDPLDGYLQYVGVYPAFNARVINSSRSGEQWSQAWGSVPETPRWGFIGNIPWEQRPAPYSFDPSADLLVSKMTDDVYKQIDEDTQEISTEISLPFARVGSIAKITLRGLPEGERLYCGTFSHGRSWQSTGDVIYDPVAEKVAVLPAPATDKDPFIYFEPAGDVKVDENREAVIWLRVLSGSLSDHFTISVETNELYSQEDNKVYSKTVTLESPITFTEGNITAFAVRLNKVQ